MEGWKIDKQTGTFRLEHPERSSGLYFPLMNDAGMMSCVTPTLGGDCKTGQNTFLLPPVSIENLHNDRGVRNFWCRTDRGVWSATGGSAAQTAQHCWSTAKDEAQDEVTLEAGLLWHKVVRRSVSMGLESTVLSFVPAKGAAAEVMQVTLRNIGAEAVSIVPTAAIPMYGRSADNIRDHRHVTTLLGRVTTTAWGVELCPTLTFDERGHQLNTVTYGVYGAADEGEQPVGFFPTTADFIGEGGSLDWPRAVVADDVAIAAVAATAEGYEALGGIRFATVTLQPGESKSYQIVLTVNASPDGLLGASEVAAQLEETKDYWADKNRVTLDTGNPAFDGWMRWVGAQPVFRRICGCSFLPHHDYGKGGRGWRDLWQDCLALLLIEPDSMRGSLLNHFGGVRMDGSNATIIGADEGEFIADRNNIVRVWMDHGMWPYRTVRQYLDQTGDLDFLLEKQVYFRDRVTHRGEGRAAEQADTLLHGADGVYLGTVLEHMLVQNLTAFYDVGDNGHIRLRGADWNDGLDMARNRGESVAFTAAYAGNLMGLAECVDRLAVRGTATVQLATELQLLLESDPAAYADAADKCARLTRYCDAVAEGICGETVAVDTDRLAATLRGMAAWLKQDIQREWIGDGDGRHWFNSYYDDHARRVEGVDENDVVRMMLTGQVFTVMDGVADEKQVREIIAAADRYLYDEHCGGYRLNTNFHEVKLDMGRAFGFAFGHKENGAVFSHMAVMYAYALISRGFVQEGWKALKALFTQSERFETGRVYPGLPEYFDAAGRGMYHYLTGSASWYLLTVVTELFGVRGDAGDLLIAPKLPAELFDSEGNARLYTVFAGTEVSVTLHNAKGLEPEAYVVTAAAYNGKDCPIEGGVVRIPRAELTGTAHAEITVELG